MVGIDVDAQSLRAFGRRIRGIDPADAPVAVAGSLVKMGFADQFFDVVWSEGAVYVLGPEGSLGQWRRLIRPHGFVVLHDAVWLSADPPWPIRDYWSVGRYGVSTLAECAERIQSCGYDARGSFQLPESAWWDTYDAPLQAAIHAPAEQYCGDAEVQALLAERRREIDEFMLGQRWYGSAFLVCQVGS